MRDDVTNSGRRKRAVELVKDRRNSLGEKARLVGGRLIEPEGAHYGIELAL